LRVGTPVVAGAGDQPRAPPAWASSLRNGQRHLGTSGVVFAATTVPALDRAGRVHTFCHAIPGRCTSWAYAAAGLSLRCFVTLRESSSGARESYDQLTYERPKFRRFDGLRGPLSMGERYSIS